MAITPEQIETILEEITGEDEVSRRALMKRRHDIYQDNGKKFLLELLQREFSNDAIKEMRIAPINVLKKICNKRSNLYKTPPLRTSQSLLKTDQALIDYYVQECDLDETMDKANRYFTLFSNTAIYVLPKEGAPRVHIVPPYLYSVMPDQQDRTRPDTWIFNAFLEDGRITLLDDVPSATGFQGFSTQKGYANQGDLVASQERSSNEESRQYIFWNKDQHFTLNGKGEYIMVDQTKGAEQFVNPIGMTPVVNLAKDRDNVFWSTELGDTVDLSLEFMRGWSDLLSIAKMQGWSQLVISSAEEPKQLSVGITKVVWLKMIQGLDAPKMEYVTPSSPLSEYKDLLMEFLGIILTTANLNPKEIGGTNGARSFSSGFQALIESSDILEARKSDMNPMRRAEKEMWELISTWHNHLFDTGELDPELRAYGKFSNDFDISIQYAEVKPLESEADQVGVIKELRAQGLITKKDALKKLNPDLSDDQINEKLKEIEQEMGNLHAQALTMFQPIGNQPGQQVGEPQMGAPQFGAQPYDAQQAGSQPQPDSNLGVNNGAKQKG